MYVEQNQKHHGSYGIGQSFTVHAAFSLYIVLITIIQEIVNDRYNMISYAYAEICYRNGSCRVKIGRAKNLGGVLIISRW